MKLKDICSYQIEKISVEELTRNNYISTENMLANKSGIGMASSLPTKGKVSKYEKLDVLISNIRPYFKKIWKATNKGGCSNDVLVFRANSNIDNTYLYYLLSDDNFFNYMMLTSKGTKMPRGDKKMIMEYEVPNHSLKIQKKISSILKSIDEKIELNNKINNNLEEQALTLFKAWFIDFIPFGSKMPRKWNIGKIQELSKDIVCGKTPSTKKEKFYGGLTPFITIPDMHNSTYIIKTERTLSDSGVKNQPKKTLPHNSICMSCIGTAGLVSLVSRESQTNQQINSIIPKEGISPYFIYLLMKNLSKTIKNLGSGGSTICNLNKTQFSNIEIIIPDDETIMKFHNIVKSNFEMIENIQYQNEKLISLRDSLLPKLMSGEINVDNIKI